MSSFWAFFSWAAAKQMAKDHRIEAHALLLELLFS
jgi:hypothetical protein